MGSDYVLELEQEKYEEYRRKEVARTAAIMRLKEPNISLEEAVKNAIELRENQDEAINNNSQEVINEDNYIEFLSPELQDPSVEGLSNNEIEKLTNEILDKELI